MKEIILNEKDIFLIKTFTKLFISFVIALNIENYNLVIFLLLIMSFV